MSVLKKKWSELVTEHNNSFSQWQTKFKSLIDTCDTLFAHKISVQFTQHSLWNAFEFILDIVLYNSEEPDDNMWADLPIYVSSFKFKDKRIITEIENRLYQYLGFYAKILTDDGVARKVVTHRTFESEGDNTGDYKNYESDTPQINLTNFDEAIDYASRLEKNEDSRHSEKSGSSDYELKSFNWDEALRNMKMVFYDDLVRYFNRIPELIYNYYALDEIPVGESVKGYFDMLKNLRDIYAR